MKLALVGASGVVGRKILQILEKKKITFEEFYPLGSTTVGEIITFHGIEYTIQDPSSFDASSTDVAILAAGSTAAKTYAHQYVNAGNYVIDLSSEYRYEDDVPLVIPEINGAELAELNGPSLISNPNCSTSQLLMVLDSIHQAFNIDILNIATYQAVSGTGKKAVQELQTQSNQTDSEINPEIYPKPIAFNVIPQCDVFLENDFTKEEMKLVWETNKILDPSISVQATCARVPVFNGHSEAVFFRVEQKTSKEEIIELLSQYKGVTVVDNPANLEYPTPREFANDTEDVYVGRIRVQEIKDESWVSMWIVADNVYGKGAALNAVQILEALVKLNKV